MPMPWLHSRDQGHVMGRVRSTMTAGSEPARKRARAAGRMMKSGESGSTGAMISGTGIGSTGVMISGTAIDSTGGAAVAMRRGGGIAARIETGGEGGVMIMVEESMGGSCERGGRGSGIDMGINGVREAGRRECSQLDKLLPPPPLPPPPHLMRRAVARLAEPGRRWWPIWGRPMHRVGRQSMASASAARPPVT